MIGILMDFVWGRYSVLVFSAVGSVILMPIVIVVPFLSPALIITMLLTALGIFDFFQKSSLLHLPVLDKNKRLVNVRSMDTIVRRQDAPLCFDMNASIYAWWRDSLLKARHVIQSSTLLYVMPEERSVDIDSELDFRWVEFLMNDEQKSAQ